MADREMRLSRHAKNKLRHSGLTIDDVLRVLDAPTSTASDEKGNAVLTRGSLTVVIAGDAPDFIVTVWVER